MTVKKIYEDINNEGLLDTNEWPSVLITNLDEKDRDIFLKRKKAVDMYLDDIPIKQIVKETGIGKNEPRRLVLRCLTLDKFGNPFGYTALIPNNRIKKSPRQFSKLLQEYPELEELIRQEYFNKNKRKNVCEKKATVETIHKHFLKKCHELNIKETEYPFNTEELGKRSLYKYILSLQESDYDSYAYRCGENAVQKSKSTGIGKKNNPLIVRPFQKVEFDGHKIDAMIAIKFKTIEGDIKTEVMNRIWLLTIIDVATRVILGYHISLNKEYNQEDVLKCIQNAVKPKEKMNLTIPGLKYPENGGFHSLCIPETEWALFDEFSCDNAKSNVAKNVLDKLTKLVKCTVTLGPVGIPERRGLQERFFRTLEENGYHRLPSTTGSNINDPRRSKNCEKNAIKYEIKESDIEELTEIMIAQYNNTPHSGISQFTPLELMKQRIEERGLVPHIIPEYDRDNINFLTVTYKRIVRGNKDKGCSPYINYQCVRYTSDILARSWNLIGKELTLLIDTEDIRVIRAYLPDGSEFGLLSANGKWSIQKHSLKTRKAINKLEKDKKITLHSDDDPIDIYYEYINNASNTSKSSRNTLQMLNKTKEEDNDTSSDNIVERHIDENKIKSQNSNTDDLDIKIKRLKPLNF